MTREEKQKAIDALKISAPVMAVTQEEFDNYIQTLNKIMDWLEQEPCEDATIKKLCATCKYEHKRPEENPCRNCEGLNKWEDNNTVEDAISREKVLELVSDYDLSMGQVVKGIHALSSVYPKAKVGKWITWSEEIIHDGYSEYVTHCKCSECDQEYNPYNASLFNYCPNCGAKMEVKENG